MSNEKLTRKEKLYTILYIILIFALAKLAGSDNPKARLFINFLSPFASIYMIIFSIKSIISRKSFIAKAGYLFLTLLFSFLLIDSFPIFLTTIKSILL